MNKEKVEKKTNNQNANNNINNSKKIIVRRRHLTLFKSWMILGLIMMVLKNTIWPEVDTQLEGFYKVATLWINVLNEICKFIFPYLSSVGEWIVQMVPKTIGVAKELWPVVSRTIVMIFHGTIKFFAWTLTAVLASYLIALLHFIILHIFSRDEAKIIIEDVKKNFSSWWSSITNKEKAPTDVNDNISNTKSKSMDANFEQISHNIGETKV